MLHGTASEVAARPDGPYNSSGYGGAAEGTPRPTGKKRTNFWASPPKQSGQVIGLYQNYMSDQPPPPSAVAPVPPPLWWTDRSSAPLIPNFGPISPRSASGGHAPSSPNGSTYGAPTSQYPGDAAHGGSVVSATPSAPSYNFADLQRKLQLAVGRFDWLPVEPTLRQAFQKEAPGCTEIPGPDLYTVLKREFGVCSVLTNRELRALIASYPHSLGGVNVEWFLHNLMTPAQPQSRAAPESHDPYHPLHQPGTMGPSSGMMGPSFGTVGPSSGSMEHPSYAAADPSTLHNIAVPLNFGTSAPHTGGAAMGFPSHGPSAADNSALPHTASSDRQHSAHPPQSPADQKPYPSKRLPEYVKHIFDRIGWALKGGRQVPHSYFQSMVHRLKLQLESADMQKPGQLSFREFSSTLRSFQPDLGLTSWEQQTLFETYDPDRTGFMPISAFWDDLRHTLVRHDEPIPEDLQQVRQKILRQLVMYDRQGGSATGLARVLQKRDDDNDGRLTLPQLRMALRDCQTPLTNNELDVLFQSLDPKHTGTISIAEFADSFYRELKGPVAPAEAIHIRVAGALPRQRYPIVSQRFRAIDSDEDGMVTKHQFIRVLQSCDARCDAMELGHLFDSFDPKHTGKVSINQFLSSLYS